MKIYFNPFDKGLFQERQIPLNPPSSKGGLEEKKSLPKLLLILPLYSKREIEGDSLPPPSLLKGGWHYFKFIFKSDIL